MESAQAGTSGPTGPVTRKRRQLEEEEEKRRKKEEMAKRVRKNLSTSFIEVDKSTGRIKVEIKEEPEEEEEQKVIIVKEEHHVPMDNAGVEEEEGLGAELTLKEFPVAVDQPIKVEVEASEGEPPFCSISKVYTASQASTVPVGVGADLLASHYVPLEEFNKLKEEMRREKEESDKRFRALEAGFQELQQKLALTTKGDQPVEMVQEEEPGSALMDTEKHPMEDVAAAAVLPTSSNAGNSAEPEDDRTLTLFPEVIKVIWNKYKYTVVTKADFLNMRLVCSTWKQGIDKDKGYSYYNPGPCPSLKEKRDITLLNGQFLWRDGKRAHFHPFKGREFEYDPNLGIILDSPVQPTNLTIEDVEVKTTKERAKCQKSIEDFLRKHGDSIKEFICGMVKDSPQFENKKEMQRTFCQWLNLMPNLENFDFSHFGSSGLELDEFPTLPKLKCLRDVYWPIDLFRKAVFNNPQISSFTVHWLAGNFTFKDVVLPQLRDLDLYDDILPFDLNLLLIPELHAPLLEKLSLGTVNTTKYPEQPGAVYAALNKFRESLQFLQIRMDANDGEVDFPVMLLLRKLVFEFDCYPFSIDRAVKDLLRIISSSCPSLEHLVVAETPTRYSGDETPLDRFHTRKRVEVELFVIGNLWKALPSLKKVEWIFPYYADEDEKFVFIRRC